MNEKHFEIVQAKKTEIIVGLSKKTGVGVEAVQAIVNAIGLDKALENRIYAEQHAKKLGVDTKTIDQVNVDSVNFTVIDVMM